MLSTTGTLAPSVIASATYTPLAGDVLTPGPHNRESEFVWDPQQNRTLTGTCGPCALAMAAWDATYQPWNTLGMFRLMNTHGLCDSIGASTPWGIWQAAMLAGLTVTEYQPYAGDIWPGWGAFLDRHTGTDVVVLELSNGQALVDEVSGRGENAVNLRYHYIAWFGQNKSRADHICADGDNYAVGNVLQRYSSATLGRAQPCAAVAIRVPATGVNTPMAWIRQSDGTGRDANGHTCGQGDMAYLAQNGLAGSDGLSSEVFYTANDSFLPLSNGRVVCAHHLGNGTWTVDEAAAQALASVWASYVALKAAAGSGSNPAEHAKATTLDALLSLYNVH